MQITGRIAALKRIAIFAGLSDQAIGRIVESCQWQSYDAGHSIVSYQDTSSAILFLLAGKARVVNYSADGKSVVFVDLTPPTLFGEIAAIDHQPRSASVEALDPCTIASLPGRAFEQLMSREPTVATAVLQHLAAEVRRLSDRVFEFSTMVVQNRVQSELIRLAARSHGEAVLSPAPSLSDIADRISTHREAVSRELSRLTALGLIRREHGDLRITDIARLSRLVNEAKGE
jgi:CRP/FNR family transcriptional regulator, cyclic AMP receptor protein